MLVAVGVEAVLVVIWVVLVEVGGVLVGIVAEGEVVVEVVVVVVLVVVVVEMVVEREEAPGIVVVAGDGKNVIFTWRFLLLAGVCLRSIDSFLVARFAIAGKLPT